MGSVNSAPVFLFDYKSLCVQDYKLRIAEQIYKHLSAYIDADKLTGYLQHRYESFICNMETTGKRSYILIDEYDKLFMNYHDKEEYTEIKAFETRFLSAGLKGNQYPEKALLTGVLRVSRKAC